MATLRWDKDAQKLVQAHYTVLKNSDVCRVIRETLSDLKLDWQPRFSSEAKIALGAAVEDYICEMFHRSLLCSEHRQCKTVQAVDWHLASKLMDQGEVNQSLLKRQLSDLGESRVAAKRAKKNSKTHAASTEEPEVPVAAENPVAEQTQGARSTEEPEVHAPFENSVAEQTEGTSDVAP